MDIQLWLSVASIAIGSSLWLSPLWHYRATIAVFYVGTELLTLGAFAESNHPILLMLFASLSVYKIINLLRVRLNRVHHDFLKRMSIRSHYWLVGAQAVLIILAATNAALTMFEAFLALAIVGFAVNLVLLSSTSRHLKTTKTLQATNAYTDAQLPTVSVLVPARNETQELEACLQALVASDYPKLEIIVLDDCSQTKKTPQIIRQFAHDGVRFIAGKQADKSWLAKNYAYQQLSEAASGEYLLFCGVDVQMNSGAIRELITTMLEKKKSMLSILPQNTFPQNWGSRLIQPMRYAWELSLPRRLFNRPPVLSTCWIIERSMLLNSGSFKATSRSILPESYFARMSAHVDGYSFLRSNMLVSDKPPREQLATTVRMRYPQLRRRLELVWAMSMLEVIGLVFPLPVAVVLFVSGHSVIALIAVAALVIQAVVVAQVTAVMYGRPLLRAVILGPLYDVVLLNYSMYRYEFKAVIWKDRNICLPIMRIDSE